MRILLDTDIGDDIDDALAIALAIRHPSIDLVGVTTVFRDTVRRARMARHLLDIYGRPDIPVYAGAGNPILSGPPPGSAELQLDLTPPDISVAASAHAVDIIRHTYAEPGSDITLVTIGALTNLALALAIDPGLATRIPRVVTMGGWFGRARPEWNIKCDAEAAAIVLKSGLPLTLVPIDVTGLTMMRPDHIAAIQAATDEPTRWLTRLIETWQSHTLHLPVLHDPLALAVALDDSRVKTETMRIEVVTASGAGRGITCIVDQGSPPVEVAMEIDGPRFVDWFTEQILTQ
jgi:purine nucleosidase